MKNVSALIVILSALSIYRSAMAQEVYRDPATASALLFESCMNQVGVSEMVHQHEKNKSSCRCLVASIMISGPRTDEIKALVEKKFLNELGRLKKTRVGGWNPAMNKCWQ